MHYMLLPITKQRVMFYIVCYDLNRNLNARSYNRYFEDLVMHILDKLTDKAFTVEVNTRDKFCMCEQAHICRSLCVCLWLRFLLYTLRFVFCKRRICFFVSRFWATSLKLYVNFH